MARGFLISNYLQKSPDEPCKAIFATFIPLHRSNRRGCNAMTDPYLYFSGPLERKSIARPGRDVCRRCSFGPVSR